MPTPETMGCGLEESLLLSAAKRDIGIVCGGTVDACEAFLDSDVCGLTGEVKNAGVLPVVFFSSMTLKEADVENRSYVRSLKSPIAATISESDTPCSWSSARNLRFSSKTLRAALWISADASMPSCSYSRSLASSSWRYSFRLARDRPADQSARVDSVSLAPRMVALGSDHHEQRHARAAT